MPTLKPDPLLSGAEFDALQPTRNAIGNDAAAALHASIISRRGELDPISPDVRALALLDAALAPAVAIILLLELQRDESLAKTIAQLVMLRMQNSELQLVRKQ